MHLFKVGKESSEYQRPGQSINIKYYVSILIKGPSDKLLTALTNRQGEKSQYFSHWI